MRAMDIPLPRQVPRSTVRNRQTRDGQHRQAGLPGGVTFALTLILALAGLVPTAQSRLNAEAILKRPADAVVPVASASKVYKITPTRALRLHIFQPDISLFPGRRPAVVYFHGGGWQTGNASQFFDKAEHLANAGIVAISVEYRVQSIDNTSPIVALMDAGSAMRYVRTNAEKLRIDPMRIAAGGGSAGGHLAAALASVDGFDDPADNRQISKRPSALLLFNPVIDNGPGGYGQDRVAAYWQKFSPLHNIRPGHPPTLVLLGTRDEIVPVATGEAYCAAVVKAGAGCTLHLFPGQKHAFFNSNAPLAIRQEVLEVQDRFLRSIGFL